VRSCLDVLASSITEIVNLSLLSGCVPENWRTAVVVHCDKNTPLPKFQSGFRKYHLTETALLKVQNGILMSMDDKEVTILVLLDLSAAFDTIKHSILLNILQHDCGVSGTALNWFDSFLSGRKQRILVGDKTSDYFNLNCGVPQGSCMGPALFTLYVSRLFNIISQYLPSVADGTQIYLSFRPCSIHSEK